MGTKNSSQQTRDRAEKLSQQIGAQHSNLSIDEIISAFAKVFEQVRKKIFFFFKNFFYFFYNKKNFFPSFFFLGFTENS